MKILTYLKHDIFFTADTHFGHYAMWQNWRKYPGSDFKFTDKGYMDHWLITQWNNTVRANDIVFHLGDVSFLNSVATGDILNQLNGEIHLIEGNHDKGLSAGNRQRFASIHDYLEVTFKHQEARTANTQRAVLSHYAFRTWNNAHYGVWNLHGHSHNTLSKYGGQLDVGVDNNAIQKTYRPVSLAEITAYMADRPYTAIDHHRGPETTRKANAGEDFG